MRLLTKRLLEFAVTKEGEAAAEPNAKGCVGSSVCSEGNSFPYFFYYFAKTLKLFSRKYIVLNVWIQTPSNNHGRVAQLDHVERCRPASTRDDESTKW